MMPGGPAGGDELVGWLDRLDLGALGVQSLPRRVDRAGRLRRGDRLDDGHRRRLRIGVVDRRRHPGRRGLRRRRRRRRRRSDVDRGWRRGRRDVDRRRRGHVGRRRGGGTTGAAREAGGRRRDVRGRRRSDETGGGGTAAGPLRGRRWRRATTGGSGGVLGAGGFRCLRGARRVGGLRLFLATLPAFGASGGVPRVPVAEGAVRRPRGRARGRGARRDRRGVDGRGRDLGGGRAAAREGAVAGRPVPRGGRGRGGGHRGGRRRRRCGPADRRRRWRRRGRGRRLRGGRHDRVGGCVIAARRSCHDRQHGPARLAETARRLVRQPAVGALTRRQDLALLVRTSIR